MKKKKIYVLLIFIIVIVVFIMFFLRIMNKENYFIELNYNEVKEKINNKDNFVLCISRINCSHCQEYKPKLKDLANKYEIKIYYIDIDSFNESEYNKFKNELSFDGATPTTIFFKNGIEKTTSSRIEGDVSKEKIINKLKKNGFIK